MSPVSYSNQVSTLDLARSYKIWQLATAIALVERQGRFEGEMLKLFSLVFLGKRCHEGEYVTNSIKVSRKCYFSEL
ncbi:MAG: hypothetical protein M3O33_19365 [Cyanobacteriota bacterium]|nr:hypothetical protein [Cyanobacteriota bacterium]